jgi:hypothetical protein
MLYSVPYWYENTSYNYVNTDFYSTNQDSLNLLQHYTILFNTFVMMNLFNQINCRKLGWSDMHLHEHLFNNKWFIFVIAGEFTMQWFIVEFPLFNTIFRTTHLRWSMHFTCWIFGAGSIIINLISKKVFDNEDRYLPYFKLNINEEIVEGDKNNGILKYSNKLQNLGASKVQEIDSDNSLDYKLLDNDHHDDYVPPAPHRENLFEEEEERKAEE